MGTFIWRAADDRMEADARMLELLGLPALRNITLDQVINISIHPIDRSRCRDAFACAMALLGTGSIDEEIRVLGANGSTRWIEIKGKTSIAGNARQVTGVITDITDRKRREENLAVLDQIADGYAR